MCYAWGSLPLITPDGMKLESKTYEIVLNQGNALDKITKPLESVPVKGEFIRIGIREF